PQIVHRRIRRDLARGGRIGVAQEKAGMQHRAIGTETYVDREGARVLVEGGRLAGNRGQRAGRRLDGREERLQLQRELLAVGIATSDRLDRLRSPSSKRSGNHEAEHDDGPLQTFPPRPYVVLMMPPKTNTGDGMHGDLLCGSVPAGSTK